MISYAMTYIPCFLKIDPSVHAIFRFHLQNIRGLMLVLLMVGIDELRC
jgi:hypothetical protein